MEENDKEYIYSIGDLLNNPINYQRTSYEGIKFLKAYFKSREKIILKDNHIKFNQIIEKFPKIELENNDLIETNQLLQNLSQQILHKTLDSEFKNHLDSLVRRFEITKKIFDVYLHDYKQHSGDFKNIKNYVFLSWIFLMYFLYNKNLKYLNVSLKINDLLCSQFSDIFEYELRDLISSLIKEEIKIIRDLCASKSVKI